MKHKNVHTSPQSDVVKKSSDKRTPGIILVLVTVILVLLNGLFSNSVGTQSVLLA